MPRKKRAKSEAAKSHYQPARTFAFTLSPPTESDNGDEIVLRLTEDGIQSLWKTWLLDEDVSFLSLPIIVAIHLTKIANYLGILKMFSQPSAAGDGL